MSQVQIPKTWGIYRAGDELEHCLIVGFVPKRDDVCVSSMEGPFSLRSPTPTELMVSIVYLSLL